MSLIGMILHTSLFDPDIITLDLVHHSYITQQPELCVFCVLMCMFCASKLFNRKTVAMHQEASKDIQVHQTTSKSSNENQQSIDIKIVKQHQDIQVIVLMPQMATLSGGLGALCHRPRQISGKKRAKRDFHMYKYDCLSKGCPMDYPTLPIGFHWAPLRGLWYIYIYLIRTYSSSK